MKLLPRRRSKGAEGYPVQFGQAGSVPDGFTALPEDTDLPPATLATVIDAQIGAELATLSEVLGQIHIILPDSGAYVIELSPPRPFLPMSITVEVSA